MLLDDGQAVLLNMKAPKRICTIRRVLNFTNDKMPTAMERTSTTYELVDGLWAATRELTASRLRL